MNTDTILQFMKHQLDALAELQELAGYYEKHGLPDTVSAADLQQMKDNISEMQQVCTTATKLAEQAGKKPETEKKSKKTPAQDAKAPVPAEPDDDDSLSFLDE